MSVAAVSALGMAATLVAVPWFVLHATGSGTWTGLVAAAETAGLLCSAVLAGPVADRLPARAVSAGADLLTASALALIPLLHSLDVLALPVLAVLAFAVGAARGPAETARQLLLPDVLERASVTVEAGTGAVEAARRTGLMAGAPLAGLLISAVGPVRTLCTDVGAALLCGALVVTLVPSRPRQAGRTAPGGAAASYLADLRAGWAYLGGDRPVRAVAAVLLVTNALDGALNGVLYPAYGSRVLHSSALFGAMVTAIGAGALLGAALYGRLGRRLPRRSLFVGAFLLVGAVRCGTLAAGPPPWALLSLLALTGLGSGVLGPLMMSVAYERVPEQVRGRVFGMLTACALAATPLGMLGAGPVLDAWGVTAALVTVGVVYLGVTVTPLVFPVWRELDMVSSPETPSDDRNARNREVCHPSL
ncbi:major facilitator superfamily protein [Streptomyces collinus Tu 365]|uniref:Major facilitator superfamily protein n=1 Tax=Streptomyces collinus (strain DSM 40733 / Tue 365) TaxID=1214242 RepID=S5UJV5_STRC3|nr:major facilitator superfamily protein [Streptomyces collinus Tu 365]AGS73561.1 major facilitator superfamily protein [Streptomyces collinus Tu 365]